MQLLFSGAVPGASDERGETALLGVLDVASGRVLHRCEYQPPASVRAAGRKVQFTGHCRWGERLYVCSFGEIVVFADWPPQRPVDRITLPGFNDLHHCHPWRGGLAVANTGLETVDLISRDGALLERWDLLADEPGARTIDPATDYRRFPDTKPHVHHVNHLFEAGGSLWATRLHSADAVCLDTPERRISLGVGMPHDGRWLGDRLVFTTTDGRLVFADPEAGSVDRVVDLATLSPELARLGWCRGVCADPDDPDRLFVAFTTLRRSRWVELGYRARWGHARPRSRIALYDLAAGRLVESWLLGEAPGWVLFQLDVLPSERHL